MGRGRRTTGPSRTTASALKLQQLTNHYFDHLKNLVINEIQWYNLPESIDARFIETQLFYKAKVLFFEIPDIDYACLPCMVGGNLNIYGEPIEREAVGINGLHFTRTIKDSVIIYNNYAKTTPAQMVRLWAERLAEIDVTINCNLNAQKTPILIVCPEEEKLTMKNLYLEYQSGQPVIFANDGLNIDGVSVLSTEAQYLVDKLLLDKQMVMNEILTFLGLNNSNQNKKERLVADEVASNNEQVYACKMAMINSRKEACEKINAMFGLDIYVDVPEYLSDVDTTVEIGEEDDEEVDNG